jgi:hypothetical protein
VFKLTQRYTFREIMAAGAKLLYYRPDSTWFRPEAKAHWVLLLFDPVDNGDGGVVREFTRYGCRGRYWECSSIGRLRYCHEPARTVFADVIARLT